MEITDHNNDNLTCYMSLYRKIYHSHCMLYKEHQIQPLPFSLQLSRVKISCNLSPIIHTCSTYTHSFLIYSQAGSRKGRVGSRCTCPPPEPHNLRYIHAGSKGTKTSLLPSKGFHLSKLPSSTKFHCNKILTSSVVL